jgi:hypothetical protein
MLVVSSVGLRIGLWDLKGALRYKRHGDPVAGCLKALALGVLDERGDQLVGLFRHHGDVGIHAGRVRVVQWVCEDTREVLKLSGKLLSLGRDGI